MKLLVIKPNIDISVKDINGIAEMIERKAREGVLVLPHYMDYEIVEFDDFRVLKKEQ